MQDMKRDKIYQAISERNNRRGLHLDEQKMAYHTGYFAPWIKGHGGRVLVVGVGHGLDALILLANGLVESIVGVDPYINEHGNDEDDYQELVQLITKLGLEDRFQVVKSTVQDYLRNTLEPFSAVFCFDVLHHIFITRDLLTTSPLFDQARDLLSALRGASELGAPLVIAETERNGLRQLLTRTGVMSGQVDYSTKQPFSQWKAAALAGGWTFVQRNVYIPYALRLLRYFSSNELGLKTISDRSLSLYENA
jgi:hypothetical protein